jgi:L-threonylcarbamoyladenylate synthase
MNQFISRATDILLGGGVITCPTEGVFGLICMPDNSAALLRLLEIKQRDPAKGLILMAASKQQLRDWIAVPPDSIPDPQPDQAITWIVPAAAGVSELVRGEHSGIAVRITTHPTARSLCEAVGSALISSSANIAGEAPVSDSDALHREFAGSVDYVLPGECGPATGPSEIIDLKTGKKLR